MSFLRKLFAGDPAPSPKTSILSTLKLLKIDSPGPLPDNYHELLFPTDSPYTPDQILQAVVLALPTATTEAAVIKLYTIIMCAVRMGNYDGQYCEALEHLQETTVQQKTDRLGQIEKSCRSYLAKLPSMCELYQFALSVGKSSAGEDSHIVLFRIMNQFSLLFPLLNVAINTAGRYFKDTLLYYKQFYRVWRAEVLLGYLHVKRITDDFLQNYRSKEGEVLACFMDSIPEIELLCDQMEAFITNKYFRGKSPNKKLYFSEEVLQEIVYYLASIQEGSKKEEDFIRTADDDFFGMLHS